MNIPLYYAKFYKMFQVTLQMQLTRPTLKRFVLLTLGVYGAKSFIISEVARQLLSLKSFSASRKMLTRFFAEPLETYRNILEIFAQRIVEKVQDDKITLILDYTRMPVINLDVLFASLPLEGRAIPIYFEILFPWIIGKTSKNLFEVNFVKKLRRILPHKKDIVITWDRGFAKGQVIKRIINIPGLYFVGRIRKDTAVFINGKKQIAGRINLEKGRIFSSPCLYGLSYKIPCLLVGYWQKKMKEPWWIVTNLKEKAFLILEVYRQRFWIEEGFRDLKNEFEMNKNYFREKTKEDRFEKFLIACVIGYFFIYALGLINRDKQSYFVESSKKKKKKISYFFLGVKILNSYLFIKKVKTSRLVEALSLAGSLRTITEKF
ncbi:MAG: transposase [Thermoplasmata archaeon]|nr:transposase [Thermoplasmata archaeon]